MGRRITMNRIATFFDTMAEQWDAISVHNPDKIRTILQLIPLHEGAAILDVGCGTGILESYLLAYHPQRIVAVDIAPQMIQKARDKYAEAADVLDFRCLDVMDLQGETFDYILIYSAYPHFMEPSQLIRHLYELLNPKGRLIICHSESKEKINRHHARHAPGALSLCLPPACEVAGLMEPYFHIEVVTDTESIYMVSGQRRCEN